MTFSQGATGLSHPRTCFELVLGVIIESVAGESGVSGMDLDIRVFGLVARPVEFLSTFKLRPPPLEERQERWDSFPDEAGKWTLISR